MARPRGFDEQKVIEDALGAFWQRGYGGTSIQDLVEATGLQRGSLYGAFGDKHGLFLAALDVYCTSFVERVQQVVDGPDPVEGLRAFVRDAGQTCRDPVAGSRGCLVGNSCNELAPHDEQARRRLRAFVVEMQQTMAEGLRRGQALGTFSRDRDPEAVATFLQCSLQGLALLAKSQPGGEVIDGVVDEILRALD